MSDPDCVVAIDLGGTKLAAALVDCHGTIRSKLRLPVEKESPQKSIEQICEVVARTAGGWEHVRAIGVAVPGVYFADTGRAWAPNLWGRDQIPLRDQLAARFPVAVVIDSDRAACVLGEQWLGAARGLTEVVFLAVGTGIGAGIITGGQLCRGAGGIAGAVGWFALDPRQKEIYTQVGCFEAEAAGPAVARRAGASAAEVVVEAARQNDAAALRVLEETAAWLAMGLANIVSILNPQMIVLGGGLMQAGDLLLETLRREVPEWAQPLAARQVRIELTQLGEDAGLLGAARLALLKGV